MANDPASLSYLPWRAPEVVDSRHLRPVDVEAARKLAWEQGYEDGYSIGLEAGMGDARERLGYLDEILRALSQPFDDLDDNVAAQLATLIQTVASRIVRREIELDASFLSAIVREGIEALPAASPDVCIIVHPDDAALIEQHLSLAQLERKWRIKIDRAQPRGGCKLLSDTAQIDRRVETRLTELITSMLDDEPRSEEPYDV